MQASETPPLRGLLALECPIGADAQASACLSQADAGELAAAIGRDLALLEPAVGRLDLVLGGAHFDPAELLRPGWPLHQRLLELLQRAPKADHPRVVAFGHAADGTVPQPLRADPALSGGGLRVMPWLLSGDADALRLAHDTLEARLLDAGMASAGTALLVQEALRMPIEHARCLTLHDLLAMTALQYRNQALDSLWPLLETALLFPDGHAELDVPPEPRAVYEQGMLHVQLPSPECWRNRCAPEQTQPDRLEHGFRLHQMRVRQFAAVAQAHGISVSFDWQDASAAP